MKICGICGKRFKSTLEGKQKNQSQIYANLRKSKSVEICGICGKRFKSTSAVQQKNQPQISQIYANPNLWKSAESVVKI